MTFNAKIICTSFILHTILMKWLLNYFLLPTISPVLALKVTIKIILHLIGSFTGLIFQKELNERALIPELRSLMQFLPLPKPSFDIITCEPYGTVSLSPQKLAKGQIGPSTKVIKQGLQVNAEFYFIIII